MTDTFQDFSTKDFLKFLGKRIRENLFNNELNGQRVTLKVQHLEITWSYTAGYNRPIKLLDVTVHESMRSNFVTQPALPTNNATNRANNSIQQRNSFTHTPLLDMNAISSNQNMSPRFYSVQFPLLFSSAFATNNLDLNWDNWIRNAITFWTGFRLLITKQGSTSTISQRERELILYFKLFAFYPKLQNLDRTIPLSRVWDLKNEVQQLNANNEAWVSLGTLTYNRLRFQYNNQQFRIDHPIFRDQPIVIETDWTIFSLLHDNRDNLIAPSIYRQS
jgi:hypothetical protein